MKRTLHIEGNMACPKIARRQDPVSCNFCRLKKLKCNRVSPCSNCVARKVQCVFTSPNGVRTRESSSETCQSADTLDVPTSSTSHLNISDIDARLRRLEQLAFSFSAPNSPNHPTIPAFGYPKSQSSVANSQSDSSPYDAGSSLIHHEVRKTEENALSTADRLESAAMKHSMVWKNGESHLDKASLPERLASPLVTTFSYAGVFPSSESQLSCSQILSILPSLEMGTALFEHYIEQAHWIYHILHIPTTLAQLKDSYARLHADQPYNIGQIALLATIFKTSAYFWSPTFSSPPYSRISQQLQNFSRKDALHCANRWSELAHRCLLQARYVSHPTIESMQAVMTLAHSLHPNEEATATYTAILATMVNSAHILGIHQIDSKKNVKDREERARRGEKIDLIGLELKRRLWWHLASSDWILTFFSGPQSGTYVVHPNQFNVSYPLNIDDAALTPTSNPLSADPSQPTEMAYFIFRCKLSAVFREIIDYAQSAGLEVEEIPYEQVLFFDKNCRDLINNAPYWLQLDAKSWAKSRQVHAERPYIARHCLLAHFGIHTRLTRLHRAYLIRGSRDPRYAYSRMMCLRSARTVIKLEKQMQQESARTSWPKQIWFVIHHVFVATVILGMDYCFNQDDLENEVRKREIMDCCRVLERSQEESEIARRGVEQLKRVLREWRGRIDGDLRPRGSEPTTIDPDAVVTDTDYLHEDFNFVNDGCRLSSTKINPSNAFAAPAESEKIQQGMETRGMPDLSGGMGGNRATSGLNGEIISSGGISGTGDSAPSRSSIPATSIITPDLNTTNPLFPSSTPQFDPSIEPTDLDWFSSFDFDPEASVGMDWEALFRDLETQPGMFDDGL